ncbi:MAG: anaerobic glycerol-3-phosphate dehydrogenase subunit B [Chloroflexi bacterium]|nr:anaerobic glycerol-3-phosphate dehydrogenase subunit B [Chloroflexota bacterium]
MTLSRLPGYDIIVIGAGVAGLMAGITAARLGARTLVVAKGVGSIALTAGTIDILGTPYIPAAITPGIDTPQSTSESESHSSTLPTALQQLRQCQPRHPYALTGQENLVAGIELFRESCAQAGLHYTGLTAENLWLPTALGTIRPAALAPTGQEAGRIDRPEPYLIAGFHQLKDFYPQYIADNLSRTSGHPARGIYLEIPRIAARSDWFTLYLAQLFDDPALRHTVAHQVRAHLLPGERVGFPAVLGQQTSRPEIPWLDLRHLLEAPVFEIPTAPPSVPGWRMFEALKSGLRAAGGQLLIGSQVVETSVAGQKVLAIKIQTAARLLTLAAGAFILAAGGFYGGGLLSYWDGKLEEPLFGLPVATPGAAHITDWHHPAYGATHPAQEFGLATNAHLQPLDAHQEPAFENLFAAGAMLAYWNPWHEKSGDGVTIATGYQAALSAIQYLEDGL